MEMQPLIYTRPTEKNLDFRWFVVPSFWGRDPEALKRMRVKVGQVLDTSMDGALRGRRVHVLRLERYSIFAWVTNEFGYKDDHGRIIRGYYGVVTQGVFPGVPNENCLKLLNERYVKKQISAAKEFGLEEKPLIGESLILDKTFFDPLGDCGLAFNFDERKIKYFNPKQSKKSLLEGALQCLNRECGFEFVYGINTRYCANSYKFMNVVCYEQPIDMVECYDMDLLDSYQKGLAYYWGTNGCRQDYDSAARCFNDVAKQECADSANALYYLSECYKNGYGVRRDKIKRLKLLLKAANQGSGLARTSLKAIRNRIVILIILLIVVAAIGKRVADELYVRCHRFHAHQEAKNAN